MEFLGRVDDQVKVRGFRIEPGEIEIVAAAHRTCPGRSSRPDDGGVRRLVAYGVPRQGSAPDPVALRAWLAERLPAHLVPAAVVLLEALPMTANAKLDRDRLPAPTSVCGGRRPGTGGERETAVCAAMAQVLALPGVGADDDFFSPWRGQHRDGTADRRPAGRRLGGRPQGRLPAPHGGRPRHRAATAGRERPRGWLTGSPTPEGDPAPAGSPSGTPHGPGARTGPSAAHTADGPEGAATRYCIFLSMPSISSTVAMAKV